MNFLTFGEKTRGFCVGEIVVGFEEQVNLEELEIGKPKK